MDKQENKCFKDDNINKKQYNNTEYKDIYK